MPTNYLNSTLSILALAILGYLGYAFWIGPEQTLAAISQLGTLNILFILSLSLINYGLRFLRWQWYLTTTSHQNLNLITSLRYYLTGFAFTTTPGKAGEIIRSLYLKQHAIPYTKSLSLLFVERFSDLLATLILAALVLWHFENYQQWIIIPIIIVLILLNAIRYPQWLIYLQQQLAPHFPNRLTTLLNSLLNLILHTQTLLKPNFLYGSLILGLLAWGAEGLGFYYILNLLGFEVSLPLAMGIYAMSLIIGALSFLPGGLGGTEAAMLIMLANLGLSPEHALAATLICRFTTLWFAVALGALAMTGLKLNPVPSN